MKKIKYLREKFLLAKKNPKQILFWIHKLTSSGVHKTLNNGERYDPNIMIKFGINDVGQQGRYIFAQKFISKNNSILDIACGTGYGSFMLSEKAKKVCGVDVSEEAINFANKKYKQTNITFIKQTINECKQKSDIVVSFETIEHIKEPIKESVATLLSLANKILIISVPFNEKINNNIHHVHFGINEKDFEDFSKEFYYQDKSGKIEDRKNRDTETLIIIIRKSH